MQENNFEANSFETSKSHIPSQDSVKDTKNSKRNKILIIISSVLAIFVAAFFLFILPALANAYEENYSRSIVIKQAGGSGADGKWVVIVDRDDTSNCDKSSNAKKGDIIIQNKFIEYKTLLFNDKNGNFHSWKGTLAGHQSVRTDGTAFTESIDCVGVTPHIKIKAPTRKGYDFTGWKVAFTNGQLSVGGAPVTFSKPVSYILNSSHTTPESVGKGIGSYYKDDYYYISAGCYEPGADGYYGKNMVITAQWKPIKYNISYTKNSGTLGNTSPTSATYGKKFNVSHPTRTGYTFNGWTITNYKRSTAKVNDTKHTTSTWTDEKNRFGFLNLTYENNATVNFEANWTENSYNIRYDLDGGTHGSSHPSSAKFSKTVTISNPSRTGYTFTGWSIDNYSPGVATVGGVKHTASSWTAEKGTKFSKLTSKRGGTVTFTAQWKKDNETGTTITVKYYDTYSGSAKLMGTGAYTYGNNYKLESAAALNMKHPGYNFKGWNFYRTYENNNGKGWLWQENPKNIYKYEVSPGNIVCIGTGGTNLLVGESDGYNRVEWSEHGAYYAMYSDEYVFGTSQTKRGTIRLYSVWESIEYNLKLDANGGTNNNNYTTNYPNGFGVKVDRNLFYDLVNFIPTRAGYEFTGWYKSPADANNLNKSALIYDALGKNTNDGTYWDNNKWKYAGNVTVYAGWKKITYNLTLNANKGVNSLNYTTPLEVTLGDTTNNNIASYKPSREGYEFDGWANYPSESEAPVVSEDESAMDENMTDDVISYTEVFDSDGANQADGIYWDEEQKWNYENDVTVYAQWRLKQCEYVIHHFYQNVDGTYTEDTDVISYGSGAYNSILEGGTYNYNEDIFITPDTQTIILDLDSSKNIINYYYERRKYDYTIEHYYMDIEGRYYEKDENVTVSGSVYYGAEITGELVSKEGFTSPEKQTITISSNSSDNIIKYYYTRNKYGYTVEHYYMNTDGSNYTIDNDVTFSGTAYYGASVTGNLVSKEGFTSPEKQTITISSNSSDNIIKYYYTRNKYGYTVEHYYMNTDGSNYTIDNDVTFSGTAYYGASVTGNLVSKAGFTSPAQKSIIIDADSTKNVIKYYYTRNKYDYTVEHYYMNLDGEGYTKDTDVTATGSAYYGSEVTGELVSKTGFTSPNKKTITISVNSSNNVIKYYYTRNKYDYTVEHYYMNTDGTNYTLDDGVTVTGTAYYNSEVTGELAPKTGFTSPNKKTITISANSSNNIIKYYYTRNKYDYTVEHYYMNVDGKGYTKDSNATVTGTAYYGAEVTGELVPKTGFTSPSQKTITIGVNSSNNVIKYYYTRNKYDYVVKHYYMNLDGIHYTLDDNVTATGSAYYGTEVTGELVPKTGFTSPEKQTITISTSISNNVIKYYYVRASYIIRMYPDKPDNASASIEKKNPSDWTWDATNKCYSKKVFYGETYVLPETKDTFGLTGWTSSGWYKADEFVGTGSKEWNLSSADGAIIELTPKWQANTYTVKLLSNKPSSASSEIQRSSLAGWDWNIVEKCYTTTFTYDSVELIPSISSPYSLTGWSVDKGWFNGDVNIGSGLKKWNLTAANGDSVSLSLTWVSNTYTVRLYENKPANATGTTEYKAPGGWSWNSSLKCYESTFKYDETNSVPSLTETFALKGWKAQNPCWSYVLPGGTTENLSNGGTKIWNLTPSPGEVINFNSRFEPVKYTVILHPNKPFKASSEIVNKLADGTGGWTYKSDKDGYVKEFTYDLEELIPALTDTYSLQGWHTTNGWYSKATDDINKAVWEEKAGVNIGSGSTTKWNLTSIDASVLDLYLDWEAYVYTLNFDYNVGALNYNSETEANLIVNGSKQDIERSREVSYDDKVGDLPLPSIAGGIFIEWNDKQDGSGNTYTKDTFYRVAGDTTIYAQYKIITANMQINSNYRNGDENKSFTVNNLRAIDKYKFMHATRQYGFGLVNPQDATRSYTDSLYNYVEAEKAYITDNANTYSCVGYNADKESHYDNNFTHKMNDNVSVLDLMYEYQALYNLENGAAAKTTFAEEYAYIKSNNLLNVDGKTFVINAIWDAYPTIEVLPKSMLQTDLAAMSIQEFETELRSFIKVTDSKPYATGDDEDGAYGSTNTKVLVSFPELSADKESLVALQSTGSASVTYCITDMAGNRTYNIVDIPVISQNPTKNYVARVDYYTRVINEQFYNERDRYIANGVPYTIEESRRSGGLLPASKWYLDPDCRNLLTLSFETLRTDNEDGYVQIWKFSHEDVLAVQQYIEDNGIGNSKSDTALKNFCEQFAYCRKK